jgi:hypothetical protein
MWFKCKSNLSPCFKLTNFIGKSCLHTAPKTPVSSSFAVFLAERILLPALNSLHPCNKLTFTNNVKLFFIVFILSYSYMNSKITLGILHTKHFLRQLHQSSIWCMWQSNCVINGACMHKYLSNDQYKTLFLRICET